jgi:hypothetical protein
MPDSAYNAALSSSDSGLDKILIGFVIDGDLQRQTIEDELRKHSPLTDANVQVRIWFMDDLLKRYGFSSPTPSA